jgi:hypothetical protein
MFSAAFAEDPELAATRPAMQPILVRMLSALAAGPPTLRDMTPS